MSGDLALLATKSLRAIEDWMATAQGNVTGASRVGFKESILMYGQGLVDVKDTPDVLTNGYQIAEQALTVGHTSLNWEDGAHVSSTQETHFAIQGDGFFLVIDMGADGGSDVGVGSGLIPALPNPNTHPVYLTRDGEFHFAKLTGLDTAIDSDQEVLVTKEGLVVLADIGTGGFPMAAANIGNSDNAYRPITKTMFYQDAFNDDAFGDASNFPGGFPNVLPSVVVAVNDAAIFNTAPTNIINKDELTFSRYGATYFEASTGNGFKTIVNGSGGNIDKRNNANGEFGSLLRQGFLESSNSDVPANLTEIAALGKVYNAFVQLIKAYHLTLDEVLRFIR